MIPPAPVVSTAASGIYNITHVSTSETDAGDAPISYELDLGSSSKAVDFVFTNVSQVDTTAPPAVSANIQPPSEQYLAASSLSDTL